MALKDHELADVLDVCRDKIAFLIEILPRPRNDDLCLSMDGQTGLYLILNDIEDGIKVAIDELGERRRERPSGAL